MAITNHPVASAAISLIAYDDETQDCFVTFTDGRQYVLPNFPGIELDRWLNSDSIGRYWNENVKGNY